MARTPGREVDTACCRTCATVGDVSNVGARELRNETRSVLERVEHGEPVTITVGGRPVATLEPIRVRGEFVSRADFIRTVVERQADPAMLVDLRDIAPDTTDDLPDR